MYTWLANPMMPPKPIHTIDYQLDLDIDCQPIWNIPDRRGMTTARLAEQLVIEFLELAQRHGQPPPRRPPRMNLTG